MSEKAFIFTLTNNQDVPPTKYDLVKKPFALCYHPEYVKYFLFDRFMDFFLFSDNFFFFFFFFRLGPIFGAGADLLIANNCNVNKESYSNLPHTYDGENASNSILMGDYHFTVIDYEVFTLGGPIAKNSDRH